MHADYLEAYVKKEDNLHDTQLVCNEAYSYSSVMSNITSSLELVQESPWKS